MLRRKLAESLTVRIFLLTFLLLLGAGGLTFALIAWATPITYTAVISDRLQAQVADLTQQLAQTNLADAGPILDAFVRESGAEAEVIFANDAKAILPYTKNVINCDIHTRKRTKRRLIAAGAEKVFSLDEILTAPVNGSGYNENYGLLGTNKATEDTVKLFPRDCQSMVEAIQKKLYDATGKHVEVMVYGDGAFKDPVGKIWELADPVVSPAYTAGLEGTPNELKLKYLADNDFAGLDGEELRQAIKGRIAAKDGSSLVGNMVSEGTTPRRLTDLIGSLCDLTSGSGDKGTPIVYIQGYFDNYTTE